MNIIKMYLRNNQLNELKMKRIIKCFCFYSFILFGPLAMAQNNEFYKVISFGEKIELGNVEITAQWKISNVKEGIHVNLVGNQINDFVFEKPGIYKINFFDTHKNEKDECNSSPFKESMQIHVTDSKLQFDFLNIKFSRDIKSGVSCEDIVVTIPVKVSTKNNVKAKIEVPKLYIAGVGCEIIAKSLQNEINASGEIQYINYQLSGYVKNSSYLMFDFIDSNNQVQTYSPTKKIE